VGRWQLRSTTDFKLEFATILAVAAPATSDQPYPDGTLEPAVYDALREGYDFVQEREPFVLRASSPGCSFTGKRTFSTLRPLAMVVTQKDTRTRWEPECSQ